MEILETLTWGSEPLTGVPLDSGGLVLKEIMYTRGGGLGSSTIFKKFNEPYAPS